MSNCRYVLNLGTLELNCHLKSPHATHYDNRHDLVWDSPSARPSHEPGFSVIPKDPLRAIKYTDTNRDDVERFLLYYDVTHQTCTDYFLVDHDVVGWERFAPGDFFILDGFSGNNVVDSITFNQWYQKVEDSGLEG